ncbi:hypothetical protein [Vibrio vulnificus]|uniref:hypothetical protein n=1 Tax=Vibrio vulnificus TaxID=672 RepID=UPI001EEFAFA3|nr:hypothetical protein [Vibrio vulnificus]
MKLIKLIIFLSLALNVSNSYSGDYFKFSLEDKKYIESNPIINVGFYDNTWLPNVGGDLIYPQGIDGIYADVLNDALNGKVIFKGYKSIDLLLNALIKNNIDMIIGLEKKEVKISCSQCQCIVVIDCCGLRARFQKIKN